MKGNLFHIQRFSLDDGSGIRTVVFLKGCNQACIWCHNPESLKQEPQWMRVDSLCTRCGKCMEVCEQKAISFSDGSYHTDSKKCVSCGKCMEQCPQSAIKLEGYEMEASDVFRTILKDKAYYEESGGGVTVSGGEPTLQGEFLLELLKLCREAGIPTAIETNGNTPEALVKRLSPLLDEVLVDFKHIDGEKHRQFTGADNKRSMEAVRYYVQHNCTEVRIPVIPGFNNTPGELQAMLDYLADIGGRSVVLLPYHTFGVSKYKNLDLTYQMGETEGMSCADVEKLLEKVKIKDGLAVSVREK